MEKSNAPLAPVKFLGNRIAYLHIQNDFVCLNERNNELDRILDVEYSIDEIFEDKEKAKKICTITLYTNVEVKDSDGLSLSVTIAVEGCFVLDSKMPDDQIRKFLSVNGCASLYSITRSILVSISAQSTDVGKIVIPMINTSNLHERDPENPLIKLIEQE